MKPQQLGEATAAADEGSLEASEAADLSDAGERTQTLDLDSEAVPAEAVPAEAVPAEATTPELEELKVQLDAALAERELAEAAIAERDSEMMALRAQLTALAAPAAPKQVSDFKAAARESAANLGVEELGVTEMQDLADVKHIGSTYEQRLYRAGVGTFWELAHLTDDDFELILNLTPMQSLAMNFDGSRASARQLAENSGVAWRDLGRHRSRRFRAHPGHRQSLRAATLRCGHPHLQ